MLLIVFVLICVDLCDGIAPVKLIAGAYWKPVPDGVYYEASIPLIYQSEFRTPDGTVMRRATHKEPNCVTPFCEISEPIRLLGEAFDRQLDFVTKAQDPLTYINDMVTEEYEPSVQATRNASMQSGQRSKRALDFISTFTSWCCGIASERKLNDLASDERTVKDQLMKLTVGLQANLRNVVDQSGNLREYEREIANAFDEMKTHVTQAEDVERRELRKLINSSKAETTAIYRLFSMVHQNLRRSIRLARLLTNQETLASCKDHQIPAAVLPPEILAKDLKALQQQLRMDGQQLAISTERLSQYYKLPICDCVFTKGRVTLTVRVPIAQQGIKWSLLELQAVQFAWGEEKCVVQHDPMFLAVAKGARLGDGVPALRPVSGTGLNHCKPYENKLCYIPRFGVSASEQGFQCAIRMYHGATIMELSEHCAFRCQQSKEMIVSESVEDTFIVTHPSAGLNIKCGPEH